MIMRVWRVLEDNDPRRSTPPFPPSSLSPPPLAWFDSAAWLTRARRNFYPINGCPSLSVPQICSSVRLDILPRSRSTLTYISYALSYFLFLFSTPL